MCVNLGCVPMWCGLMRGWTSSGMMSDSKLFVLICIKNQQTIIILHGIVFWAGGFTFRVCQSLSFCFPVFLKYNYMYLLYNVRHINHCCLTPINYYWLLFSFYIKMIKIKFVFLKKKIVFLKFYCLKKSIDNQ